MEPTPLATEGVNRRFTELDAWPLDSALEAMWEGQVAAVAAIRPALGALTRATDAAAQALGENGRLVYVGAGTSGRVAVQDGAELPPTFDWPIERLLFLMAGGDTALLRSVEGAEDDAVDGGMQISRARLGPSDVVIGVAASGTTPFTVAAIEAAAAAGAVTIGIANNAGTPLLAKAQFPVLLASGSELIAGSTRMKAGTAQKIALNLISTGVMLRLGRVYRGMMVNMHVANAKLRRRAEAMVSHISGCDASKAAQSLDASNQDVKLAAMLALGLERRQAEAALVMNGGNLRLALAHLGEGGT